MPGYSGTPLPKKLGIKPGFRVALDEVPLECESGIEGRACRVRIRARPQEARRLPDGVHEIERRLVQANLPSPQQATHPAGMFWVAWPKKSSGVATDLDENIVREIGLAAGLVDVKVCAVTEVWSGLKFVRRVKDR